MKWRVESNVGKAKVADSKTEAKGNGFEIDYVWLPKQSLSGNHKDHTLCFLINSFPPK